MLQGVEVMLSEADLAELNNVAIQVEASDISLENVDRDQFPLPTLGPKLEAIHQDLIFGRGIRVLKHVPLGQEHSMRWVLSQDGYGS